MRIDIATLFPEMCEAVLSESIIGRARKAEYVTVECHNIRDYTEDKHHRVDDKPYGGGTGMVMQADPIYRCLVDVATENARMIYLSPQGKTLNQDLVRELASQAHLVLLCGHYEGVDQRVLDELQLEEISVGDFVVTGGELPALLLTDAVLRLQAGVLPNEEAYTNESHFDGILEHPLYTRPEVWHGRAVPEVLISGHHKNIESWQKAESVAVTKQKRPELLESD